MYLAEALSKAHRRCCARPSRQNDGQTIGRPKWHAGRAEGAWRTVATVRARAMSRSTACGGLGASFAAVVDGTVFNSVAVARHSIQPATRVMRDNRSSYWGPLNLHACKQRSGLTTFATHTICTQEPHLVACLPSSDYGVRFIHTADCETAPWCNGTDRRATSLKSRPVHEAAPSCPSYSVCSYFSTLDCCLDPTSLAVLGTDSAHCLVTYEFSPRVFPDACCC